MSLSKLGQILIKKIAFLRDRALSTIASEINKLKDKCPSPSQLSQTIEIRNKIVDSLNSIKTTFTLINSVTIPLDKLLPPLTIAINLIKLLPIPSSVPPGIGLPVGVITTVGNTLDDIKDVFKNLTNQLNSFDSIIDYVVSTINLILEQLALLDLLINKCRSELISSSSGAQLLLTNSVLSPVDPELLQQVQQIKDSKQSVLDLVYKGFTFEIIEDENLNLSISRRYAVAKNPQGIVLLKTDPSFTNDPNILIEELKFLIDRNGLIAN